MAESSPCLSLRGTSLYALSLLSKTAAGKKLLANYEWQSPAQLGAIVCFPNDVHKFFAVAPINYKGDFADQADAWRRIDEVFRHFHFPEEKQKVLRLIANLSSHVTQKTALPELNKIVAKSPQTFMDEGLFHCVVIMLNYYCFKLQVRRYLLNLFDKLFSTPSFLPNYCAITEHFLLP